MSLFNFNGLIIDNIWHWSKAMRTTIFLGITLLTFVLGYWLMIKNNITYYEHLKDQEGVFKLDFEQKQHQVFDLVEYHRQVHRMKKHLVLMLKHLPAKNEMPGLLEEITKKGVAAGLKFEFFAPESEVNHDFYVELPIKMAVVGNYFQLALFLSQIGQMQRIVTTDEFTIKRLMPIDKTLLSDDLRMNITAKIYRYRPQ